MLPGGTGGAASRVRLRAGWAERIFPPGATVAAGDARACRAGVTGRVPIRA